MSIRVRNPGTKTIRDVAVTVETRPRERGAAPVAFAQAENDPRLSDPDRPIWILDREPRGATTAYTNTWAVGPLRGGQSRTFEWHVTPVQPGRYTVVYRVTPGLDGRARLADGSRARGSFTVTVADEPVPARVDDEGNVIRGEEAGAGSD
jgi:hypothetical protein